MKGLSVPGENYGDSFEKVLRKVLRKCCEHFAKKGLVVVARAVVQRFADIVGTFSELLIVFFVVISVCFVFFCHLFCVAPFLVLLGGFSVPRP